MCVCVFFFSFIEAMNTSGWGGWIYISNWFPVHYKNDNNQFHKLLTADWVPFACMLVPCGSREPHNVFIHEDTLKAWGMAFLF